MTISALSSSRAHHHGATGLALRALEYVHARLSNAEARDELAKLSDRDLLDIGLERHDIEKAIAAQTGKPGYRTF